MALMYEVTGYDRETGCLVVAYEIPENEVSAIKQMAGVRSTDDGLGSYPLDVKQLAEIAGAIRGVIPERVDTDYFLEPYEQEPRIAGWSTTWNDSRKFNESIVVPAKAGTQGGKGWNGCSGPPPPRVRR